MTLDELLARQQSLLIRSGELRVSLAYQIQFLKTPLAVADQARQGVQWLQQNPKIPLGILLASAVFKPRRVFRLARKALWAYGLFRRAKSFLPPI